MKLHINSYEHEEHMENLLGICPLCAAEALRAEITVVYDFEERDVPVLDIKELTDEQAIFGDYR